MAKNSKCHKFLCQWIYVLPKVPPILEPYSFRALWRGSPPNPLSYTTHRQPSIHTYPPLKHNTIPKQFKAIIPTHEPDFILSQALKHQEIRLYLSIMPQTSHTQQKKLYTGELPYLVNAPQLNLPCIPPCHQLR